MTETSDATNEFKFFQQFYNSNKILIMFGNCQYIFHINFKTSRVQECNPVIKAAALSS